jgi:hypothetical protein
MSDVVPVSALLVFARTLVKLIPEIKPICGGVQQLCNNLKPVLLQKLKDAGIDQNTLASVVQEGGKLIYAVAGHPLFLVTLAAGTAVLAQLGLEYAGYKPAGQLAGVAGITATGSLVGYLLAPIIAAPVAVPVAVGAVVGALAWTAVDVLRSPTIYILNAKHF